MPKPMPVTFRPPKASATANHRVHAIQQSPSAILHADHRLAVLRVTHAAIEEAWVEIVVADERGSTFGPSHLRASGHVRRRAPHAEESVRKFIVPGHTAQAVVYRDQFRHVQFQHERLVIWSGRCSSPSLMYQIRYNGQACSKKSASGRWAKVHGQVSGGRTSALSVA
jgi:hypothetical protein